MAESRGGKTRRVRNGGLTKAKRQAFLAVLTETGNAAAAGRAAGYVDASPFHNLRNRDEAFDAAWSRAVERGVEALKGTVIQAVHDGRADLDMAIRLIGQQESRLAKGPDHQRSGRTKIIPVEQARGEILRRLDRLMRRSGQ